MYPRILFSLIIFLAIGQGSLFAQTNKPAPQSAEADALQKQANDFYLSFKNGPAFDALSRYASLKEKQFIEAKEQLLKKNEAGYKNEVDSKEKLLDVTNKSIEQLQIQNDSLAKEKSDLIRNTVIYFVIIISAATFFLFTRKKRLTEEIQLKEISELRMQNSVRLAEVPGTSVKLISDLKFAFSALHELAPITQNYISKIRSMAVTMNRRTETLMSTEESMKKINTLSENYVAALDAFKNYFPAEEEEKQMFNLNKVADDVMYLSYLWTKSRYEDFDAQMAKDLEKILPDMMMYPSELRRAFFYFFNNAFLALYKKSKTVNKGFIPKVSVTTRKLPSFIQVRIKDNGIGIEPAILPKIFDPFYSTLEAEQGFGLGLTDGAAIIKAKHGGEIIVESEPGTGTDLLIRFPLKKIS